MKEFFDLNKYISDNHALIMESKEKDIEFEWDERGIEAVYKLAGECAKKNHVLKEKIDDFVQDCVGHFFTYIIYKWDPTKEASIVTYSYKSFNNVYLMTKRKSSEKLYEKTVSLDNEVKNTKGNKQLEEFDYIDTIVSNDMTPSEQYEHEEYYNFLNEKLNEDELLYAMFVEKKAQLQIADKMGISQSHVSRIIKRKLKEIKDEWKGKSAFIKRGRK